jgi:hypothetical protein
MDSLISWELICYRLVIRDIVALFQVNRSMRTLSDKKRLWMLLMERDYPDHHRYAKSHEKTEWYQDLYQYGAYWCVSHRIRLFPGRILYASVDHICDQTQFFVTTNTERDHSKHEFPRYYGQQYVGLIRKKVMSSQSNLRLADIPCTHSLFSILNGTRLREILFVHQKEVGHKQIAKWDASRYAAIITWICTHFEAEIIEIGSDSTIYFQARLREKHIVRTFDTYIDVDRDISVSAYLSREMTNYEAFQTKCSDKHGTQEVSTEIFSTSIHDNIATVNDIGAPLW